MGRGKINGNPIVDDLALPQNLSVYGAVKKSSVYVTRAKTKLYKRSGSSLKGNGTLSAGKYVVVYRTYGNWAYVKTMSGKGAYVNKNYLKKAF